MHSVLMLVVSGISPLLQRIPEISSPEGPEGSSDARDSSDDLVLMMRGMHSLRVPPLYS